jgi:cyanate permease
LGAISGLNTSLTVFLSAVGPAAFSLALDFSGDYQLVIKVCIAALVLLLLTAMLVKQDELAESAY